MAASRQQTFSMDIASDLFVRGDRKDLGRLLSILLDNAVKYCPPQGYIHLTLKQTGKYLCLKLTNTAQSIHPSDLPHLFDRFYRTDTSRNSETGGYGSGFLLQMRWQALIKAGYLQRQRMGRLSPSPFCCRRRSIRR